jgi:glutamine amidotransferase
MMPHRIVIVDYGMGNLWSVVSAFKYLGCDVIVSRDSNIISNANMLVLPGVGSFKKAMIALEELELVEPLKDAVLLKKTKILGICLGMQLFAEYGNEDGFRKGLNFVGGTVNHFAQSDLILAKLPHIGFNNVSFSTESRLGRGIKDNSDFYFVHSYHLNAEGLSGEKGICNYGMDFLASYESENIFATQFHPEKSQTNGLNLLNNFLLA